MVASRGAPWFPIKMMCQLVAYYTTPIRKLYNPSDRVCQQMNDEGSLASFSKKSHDAFLGLTRQQISPCK